MNHFFIYFRVPLFVGLFSFMAIHLFGQTQAEVIKLAEDMEILPISENIYIHKAYVDSEEFGKFTCNGVVYVNDGQAIVFDTPVEIHQTELLLDWLVNTMKWEVVGIMVNHFHMDCLGGLSVFHDKGITSYSSKMTQKLAAADHKTVPQKGFQKKRTIKVGSEKVEFRHFGAAHTLDNAVGWVQAENLLFGGCMLKSLKAGKGNLADADTKAWPETIKLIKAAYPSLKIAVPGHGKYGGMELLDYTIEMFEEE